MSRLPRDIQCGMDVGRMAELGKFDKEFTVYGCAYWQNGEAYYPLSNKAESIYRFCEAGRLPNILTTAVMSYTVTTSVPSGTCDDIWQTVQWQLARKLAAEYADGYLELLSQLAAAAATDAAWPILQHVQQLLEGRFQRDQLTLFARLAEDCLAAKYLTTAAYQQLQQWLAFNWRQMEDDVLLKDSHGRTLHGFAYRQSGQIRYHYDAQYAVIYHKRQQRSRRPDHTHLQPHLLVLCFLSIHCHQETICRSSLRAAAALSDFTRNHLPAASSHIAGTLRPNGANGPAKLWSPRCSRLEKARPALELSAAFTKNSLTKPVKKPEPAAQWQSALAFVFCPSSIIQNGLFFAA